MNGIVLSGGTTVTTYNNLIGDLKAPASTSTNAIRGISITSTTLTTTYNVYYNTVYLTGTGVANFGTSGIYHTASTTSSTAKLDLRNNIVVNNCTPAGTGLAVAYRRSSGTANMLNNYASTSNNNLFYAGTPGASNLIYSDGTSSAQTIALYKAGAFTAGTITPRDAGSVTENPNFLSTTGSNANFLHINTTIATPIESGGANIATYTDDFDGNVRQGNPGYPAQVNGGGTAPDIGADEFDGTLLPVAKSLTSITYNQASTNASSQGSTNQEILRLDFLVTGNSGTLNLNSIIVNSLNTTDVDVTSIKLYRTSTTTFATTNPLGSATTFSGGNATFSSLSYDLPSGTTYIWAAYDISASATVGNTLDAQIQANQINVAGTTYPASDQSPTGTRLVQISPITSFPFNETFEAGNFNNWIVANGSQTNKWAVGTATFNAGSYSGYVSNDAGVTNAYTILSASSVSHFYRDITFPASGEFHLSFNWKGNGESGYDDFKVFLVDVGTTPTAGTVIASGQIGTTYGLQSTWQAVDLTFAATNLGTTKRLVFSWRNDGSGGTQPPAAVDNIQIYQASNMAYSSSAVTQTNISNVYRNTTNNQVIGIQVVTTGSANPINATKFTVNTNGTTLLTDITNAKIFYTGTSSTFAATGQFGSTVATPLSSFDITGTQALSTGTNYFWLTYDVPSGATGGNVIDGECTNVTVAGTDNTPTPTTVVGSRTIQGAMHGTFTVGTTLPLEKLGLNFENRKFTKTVIKDVPIEENSKEKLDNNSKINNNSSVNLKNNLNTKKVEVQEDYYVLYLDGKPYTGPTYFEFNNNQNKSSIRKNSKNDNQNIIDGPNANGDYLTLDAAITDINLRGIDGAVTFLLSDASMTSNGVTINALAGFSSSNTLTIKPNTGKTVSLSGSSSTGIINLSSADYVTIDGSNTVSGTTKDLTIINTFNTYSSAGYTINISGTSGDKANK